MPHLRYDGILWYAAGTAGRTEELVPTVRRAVGDEIDLKVDANSCYTPIKAIEVSKLLQDNGVSHLEEPCPYWELDWTAEVTRATNLSVAGGEQDYDLKQWERMTAAHVMDIAQPDVCYIGGITRAMHAAKMAEKAGMPFVPHSANHMSSEHDPAYEIHFKYFKNRLESLGLHEPQVAQSLNKEKITFARKTQYLYSMLDSLNLCQFVYGPSWQLYGPEEIMKLVQAVTGWDVTIDELIALGERRLNMMRVFNAREGINRNQDQLPVKFYQKPLKGGPTDGWKIDKSEFEDALEEYYRQCGWDIESGTPTRETLERLGLLWTADNLP